jgi:hypothetical protein
MRMNSRRMLVPFAAVLMAACGGGDAETEGAAAADSGVTAPPAGSEAPALPANSAGKVDTAGVGTNPPTAGGQIVDTAAVPGPTDTAQGTQTAP